jgi:hypothetical protein
MDSRWNIEYWNYYDWLGVASAVILVAMLAGGVVMTIEAAKQIVRNLK